MEYVIQELLFALVFVTAGVSAAALFRHREAHRLDIFLFALAILLPRYLHQVPAVLGFLGPSVFDVRALLALRLVSYFRALPRGTLALATTVYLGLVFGHIVVPDLDWPGRVFTFALFAWSAVVFASEGRRVAGVSRHRLLWAAAGTAFALAVEGDYLAFHLFQISPSMADDMALGDRYQWFYPLAYSCYFLAFATPKWLLDRWQQAEQSRYLAGTTERDVEERARRAPEDLNRAAARSVGHALTLVAIAEPGGALAVRASTRPELVGLEVPAGEGLLSQVWRTGDPDRGSIQDCGPTVAARLSPFGQRVLVAPVAASDRCWGVAVVVQSRGSLFPDDDLKLLAQFARYAAIALDHGALVAEAHARERRAADRRLREVEARMGLMLDSIKDYAMLIVDTRGRVAAWHVGARHVFGYAPDEMAEELVAPLFELEPPAFAALLDEARQLGQAGFEGACRRKDGGRFIGQTTIRPLVGEVDAEGFAVVTRDVTEQRQVEARLRRSQKMEAIGQLAGGVAHDFNNLLTTILGQSDRLEQELAPSDPHQPLAHAIRTAAERAAGFTQHLLTVSREQMVAPAVMNLRRVVEELVPMLRRSIGEAIAIDAVWDASMAPVLGERSRVEQVVLNLVVNARDATPPGGRVTLRVGRGWLDEVATRGEGPAAQYVWIEVRDTGVGMDEATRARIFEPFFTTKPVGQGTGLGLATVYGIVRQMGGFVAVTSEVGQGATFRVCLPEAQAEVEAAPPRSGAELFESLRGQETVLLAEDDEGVRDFVAQTLRRFGYRTIVAGDGQAALALADAHVEPIHLVVTDVIMPGGSGPDLARALAERRPGVPVLFISGYADAELARSATVPKASHLLQKPFTATDLLARVRQLLAARV
ncbi:MAG: ATP-binding protein [Vicinamibacterales bacterium]